MKVTLGSISKTIIDGDWIESKDQAESGIRLIQTGNVGEGEYLDKIERAKYISESTFHELNCTEIFGGDILISRLPEPVGRACILPSNLGRTITAVDCTIVRLDEEICDTKYLLYFTQSDKYYNQLKQYLAGTTRTRISRKNLEKIEIDIPSLDTQREVVCHFDSLITCINKHKKLMETYDEMIKSRFIELFGDPVVNPHNWEKVALSDLAEIKIGPFGSLLHKEDYIENGHALVNPSHIIDGKIAVDNKLTVSEEKYAEMSAYHLRIDDVVMGRRGEMGRCAVVDRNGLLCGTGSLLIRSKGEVTADFIQKVISFPSYKKTIEDMAVGQTMPNLNVPIVSSFMIIKPPMSVQRDYYDFVEQVENAKIAVQESLDNLEILKKALMQKYFG